MALRSLRKKPSLVGRLRQLRTAALAPSKATLVPEGGPSYAPPDQQPANKHPRGKGPKKPMSNPRSYYPEPALDLDELDSKLERYAQMSLGSSASAGTDGETGGLVARGTSHARQTRGRASTADPSGDERDPSSCLHPAASLGSPSQGPGSPDSCLVPPQQHEAGGDTGPTDYELFMRDAEQAERRRVEDRDKPPRPAREAPLNPFYSVDWGRRPSQPPPRLGGIREAADDDAGAGHGGRATPGDRGSTQPAPSSEASSERCDVDAGPLKRANTDTTGGGRRITFSNACVPRDRTGRRASAPNCATRVKSPSRPVRKRKSIKQLIADYIRPPPRG